MNFRIFNHLEYGDIRFVLTPSAPPLFVAKDIADVLGYGNYSKAISKYCQHPVLTGKLGMRTKCMRLIPETDIYRLALHSKSRVAAGFLDWICEEVLPRLRKAACIVDKNKDELRATKKQETKASEKPEPVPSASNSTSSELSISESEKMLLIADMISAYAQVGNSIAEIVRNKPWCG